MSAETKDKSNELAMRPNYSPLTEVSPLDLVRRGKDVPKGVDKLTRIALERSGVNLSVDPVVTEDDSLKVMFPELLNKKNSW